MTVDTQKRPTLLFRGPVETVSGYGAHSRDLLKSFYDLDLFEIKVDSCPWGYTPTTALNEDTFFNNWIKSNIVVGEIKVPDVYVQVTVPNEFQRMGKVNIGVTAGIESTVAPKDWIDGCNRMDLILTTSNFSKNTLVSTVYNETEKSTGKIVKVHKIEKPIEVLFEGVNTNVYKKIQDKLSNSKIVDYLNEIPSDFCFLFVGHWLNGKIGHDRKDVGMLIKCFCSAFNEVDIKPSLILKTSSSNFSVKERERLKEMIVTITSEFKTPPPVYLLFGELSDEEMNLLYNHDKVKAMITLTKGEGFGRPLLEFSLSGKPIIASNWSGHLDFLSKERNILLSGNLTNIDDSASDKFLLKDGKWFTADYDQVISILKYFISNYDKFKSKSEEQGIINKNEFSLERMTLKLNELVKRYIVIQKREKLVLPTLKEF
jgi:glycosyltransferase involved in cell wall biosynthesis